MLAKRALRHPLSSDSSALPFLYCTKTILRRYANAGEGREDAASNYSPFRGGSDGAVEESQPHPEIGRQRSKRERPTRGTRFEPSRYSSEMESPLNQEFRPAIDKKPYRTNFERPERKSSYQTNFERSERKDSYPTSFEGRERKKSLNEDNVPFERPAPRADPHADLAGSTITPNEKKAFESLFQLRSRGKDKLDSILSFAMENIRKENPGASRVPVGGAHEVTQGKTGAVQKGKIDAVQKGKSDAVQKSKIDAVRKGPARRERPDSEQPRFPAALRQTVESAQVKWREQEKQPESSQTEQVRQQAEKLVARSSMDFRHATTDMDLWEKLSERVLKRVLALELDGKKGGSETQNDDKPDETPTSAKETTPSHTTDLQILTIAFPEILLSASSNLSNRFPGSPLSLTLLPYVRSLGPATSALGLSTALYTAHMRTLWHRSQNLPAILAILAEMDHKVYDFDDQTAGLLREIQEWDRKARMGHLGEAQSVLWSMKARRKYVEDVKWWVGVVNQRRQAAELRRSQEGEWTGYEEESEDSHEGQPLMHKDYVD